MDQKTFAARLEPLRMRLYKTALLYLDNESQAVDAVDEAVYKGLRSCRSLRQPEYFETWLTRILINVCYDQLRRQKRFVPLEELSETAVEDFDALPLKEALRRLPKELRDVVILRFFADCTLAETADILGIPPGTAATRQRKALQLLRLELREEVTP
ncbi:MAG: sigma-70 family RNA polymerase sigma factor [Clostridia bacterium]|nr:sigma-70 family RNA polymerase sigma factor [Clostridia bacterium]